MNQSRILRSDLLLSLLALLLLAGCAGTETVISSSQQIITDDEDGRSTIVDVKIQKYETLARDFPKEPRYQERLARYYWEKRDHQSALGALAKARKIDSDNPRYDYQSFSPLANRTDLNRQKYAILQTHWHQNWSVMELKCP